MKLRCGYGWPLILSPQDIVRVVTDVATTTMYLCECWRGVLARRDLWRRAHLQSLQTQLAEALGTPCPTPIVPILVGSADEAMRMSAALWQRGLHVPAIRPPTVPDGTSRLRVSLSAEHTAADVQALIDALREVSSAADAPGVLGVRMGMRARL